MLSKQQKRAALKLTRHETRQMLWELRQKHDMSLEDLSLRAIDVDYLVQLAAFYDKRVKIDLIDYPPAKDKDKE